MREVLRINVILDRTERVMGGRGEAVMILFHGSFSCELGEGEVLNGGVDTQIRSKDKPGTATLSARYILAGKDKEGREFRIFVENNGVCREGEAITTEPVIYTDAEPLRWMEREKLAGTVEGEGGGHVRIKIYKEGD